MGSPANGGRRGANRGQSMAMKALVVDDSNVDRTLLADFLRSEGYEVVEADEGLEGFELAKSSLPDLVFMDVVMPGASGFEVCRMLKSDPSTAEMPVVMVTHRSQLQDKMWAQRQGANGYVTKPWTGAGIIAAVSQLQSLPRWKANTERAELAEAIALAPEGEGALRI